MMDFTEYEEKIKKVQEQYEELYENSLDDIDLDGKKIHEALKLQIQLQLQWELFTKKVSNLHDTLEYFSETAFSEAIERELRDSYKTTTITEAKAYAGADKSFKRAKALMLMVREIRDESRGILEVINSRKYTLNNLSNLIIAGSENHIL